MEERATTIETITIKKHYCEEGSRVELKQVRSALQLYKDKTSRVDDIV